VNKKSYWYLEGIIPPSIIPPSWYHLNKIFKYYNSTLVLSMDTFQVDEYKQKVRVSRSSRT
jgi:hypothetical protein